jgi:chemotaxis protein CheD
MKKTIYIGIGELAVTADPEAMLKTMALGSCVGVIMLDPSKRTIGMVHIALPDSTMNKERAAQLPGYFADSGIPALLKEMAKLGCAPDGKGFIVKLAGGANVLDPANTFNIGKRNILAIKKILWGFRMGAVGEDVGGEISRTVEVHADSGKVVLSSPNKPDWEV